MGFFGISDASAIAAGPAEPGYSSRTLEPSRDLVQAASGVVDAGGRGFPCASQRSHQRREWLRLLRRRRGRRRREPGETQRKDADRAERPAGAGDRQLVAGSESLGAGRVGRRE